MIAVIMPTLNEAARLPDCLAALAGACKSGLISEVIIVDGGSADDTVAIAQHSGATVLRCAPGRGGQLAAGAAAATANWLLFLHADTLLGDDWQAVCRRHIAQWGPEVAGYFRFRLRSAAFAARLLETAVAWRCRLFALPYGDQGLLIARQTYEAVGGYPDLPLMEDVALVRALGRRRLRCLPCAAVTSAARYQRDGYLRRSLRNLYCLALYFAGMAPARIAQKYR